MIGADLPRERWGKGGIAGNQTVCVSVSVCTNVCTFSLFCFIFLSVLWFSPLFIPLASLEPLSDQNSSIVFTVCVWFAACGYGLYGAGCREQCSCPDQCFCHPVTGTCSNTSDNVDYLAGRLPLVQPYSSGGLWQPHMHCVQADNIVWLCADRCALLTNWPGCGCCWACIKLWNRFGQSLRFCDIHFILMWSSAADMVLSKKQWINQSSLCMFQRASV